MKKKLLKNVFKGETLSNCTLDMKDLIDDDSDQIIISDYLLNAFDRSLKSRKFYEKEKVQYLFKYIVYLYNDTLQVSDKFGALTYLEKISNCLDYLKISNIVELSLEQLNRILDCQDEDIQALYNNIKENRYVLTNSNYRMYVDMLKDHNNYNAKTAKKIFSYICSIYNENTIIQDNVNYVCFLKEMASLVQENIPSMRIYQILDLFKLYNVNYEKINEAKKLLNDTTNISFSIS